MSALTSRKQGKKRNSLRCTAKIVKKKPLVFHLFLKTKRLTCPLNLKDIRFPVEIDRNPFSIVSKT